MNLILCQVAPLGEIILLLLNWHVTCFIFQLEDNREEESSISYAASTGTIGRAGIPVFKGAEDMMSEMALRLRQRRAKTEGGSGDVRRMFVNCEDEMRND